MRFTPANSTCAYFWLFAALLGRGWSQTIPSTSGSAERPSTTSSCPAPAQPVNGKWRLHPDSCKDDNVDCKVPEGTELELGSELVYICGPGPTLNESSIVYCRHNKKWSSIPSCIGEIRCEALNSVSWTAQCVNSGNPVNCDLPVLPKTRAKLSCNPWYKEDLTLLAQRKKDLNCNENGEWEPRPFKCIPVCGLASSSLKPFEANESPTKIGECPWHASIYMQTNTAEGMKIQYRCGATLIRENFLLTAAQCVYDEKMSIATGPEKLLVMMGNVFREFDDPKHDPTMIKKRAVKNVYINNKYVGLREKHASDIALVELKEPFVLSASLLPACFDTSYLSNIQPTPGLYGRIAGFGKADTSPSSPILQTIMVPYISYTKCLREVVNNITSENLFTSDNFCANYTDVSVAVCESDIGGGLVFSNREARGKYQWYIRGIASTSLIGVDRKNKKKCGGDSYMLYTRVSLYTEWILDVISNEGRPHSDQPRQSSTTIKSTTMPTSTERPRPTTSVPQLATPAPIARSSCLVPPQPANGRWKLHHSLCTSDVDCNVPQGTELEPGSQLVYSCDDGYKPGENSDYVYCGRSGTWSSLPVCIELSCTSLNSPSTLADCRNLRGSWISCDPSVPPQTLAVVSCRPGYREYTTLTAQTRRVFCSGMGKWDPEPIQCVPDCGIAITQVSPHVVNGITAKTGDFPWHASLYVERTVQWSNETRKEYICGATIIQPNLLLTAAHCVYNAEAKAEQDPTKLFVATGNIFRNYDYEWHNPITVQKRAAKKVYRHCKYYGQAGAYASDIALIELQEPFELSNILLPACLHPDGHDEQILEYGRSGKVAGFGRTAEGPVSSILQTLTVPYIPYYKCKTSSNAEKNSYLISDDKFCAGHTNGSAVCDGDSGGGLVFQIGELWHVMGIVSVGLGVDLDTGEKTCDNYSYTLYTRVSRHILWIQEIIRGLHLNRPVASCDTISSSPFRNRRDSLHYPDLYNHRR